VTAVNAPDRLASVRLVVFDFDGVFTDNRVLVMQDGSEGVFCSRADGLGVRLLQDLGVECMVLSTETNPVVEARCRKMRMPCISGQWNKEVSLEQLVAERSLAWSEVAYVGNDINDLGCLRRVGLPIGVADADPEIVAVCALITTRRGGQGAVREVCDWFLRTRGSAIPDAFDTPGRT
jgi:YrbI family 3-deoxy-D-manno-octulosonate 8-phosphate phosphatase